VPEGGDLGVAAIDHRLGGDRHDAKKRSSSQPCSWPRLPRCIRRRRRAAGARFYVLHQRTVSLTAQYWNPILTYVGRKAACRWS
jgi:hypothetical protein